MWLLFSCLTSIQPSIVTKRFELSADGSLKRTTTAQVSHGRIECVQVEDLRSFGMYISELATSQALLYGVPLHWRSSDLVTQRMLDEQPEMDAIARTNRHFYYAKQPGILMLDYDPPSPEEALSKQELVKRLRDAVPELSTTALLWVPSASSHISKIDGADITGLRGQRLYVAVTDASDIPRLSQQIVIRLWAGGEGRYDISKSGALLKRTIIDTSVWQPSRLDFAAGASLGEGLEQRRGMPELIAPENCDPEFETSFFNSRALLPDANPEVCSRADAAMRVASELKRGPSQIKRRTFVAERIEARLGGHEEAEETIMAAINDATLAQDFVLHLQDLNSKDRLEMVTVGQVMADLDKYDGRVACDPIEPSYNSFSLTAKLYLRGKHANIFSLAHGGRNYRLVDGSAQIIVEAGGLSKAVGETLVAMEKSGKFLNLGDAVVTVRGHRPTLLNADSMNYRLGQFIRFKKVKTIRGEDYLASIDPPDKLGRQILNIGKYERPFPSLLGIIKGPFIRPDGSICDRPGFDPDTGTYGDFIDSDFPDVPAEPTMEECRAAHALIWSPFKEFELDDPASRTSLLCAILTSAIRAAIDRSPMFAAVASEHARGKTTILEALGMLAIGVRPSVMPPLNSSAEDEMRKRLTASLLPPAEPVLLIDNLEGFIGSTVLASFVTACSWSDRILGQSRIETELPNRALILLSGKSLQFKEELGRRTLAWTIKASSSASEKRTFSFCPVELMSKRRPEIIVAILTLMRAAHLAGPVSMQQVPSFPAWDKLVRQTVLWLSSNIAEDVYEDPLDLFREATEQSADRSEAYELLYAIRQWKGEETFFAADLAVVASTAHMELQVLLEGLAGRRGATFSSRSVGRYLHSMRNRPYADLVLRSSKNANMCEWRVECVEP